MWIRTQDGKLLNDHYVYTFSLVNDDGSETLDTEHNIVAMMREGRSEVVFKGDRSACKRMLDLIIYHMTIGATYMHRED